jgi:A/G-specific adenine glycosylase
MKKIQQFQEKIFSHYYAKGRKLPWRKTTDPYKIMISEMMLQQTQVDRVIPYYHAWIKKWPTIQKLAQASRVEVLKQWQGLGYNNRAIRVHQLAQEVSKRYSGNLITALQHEKFPGIGPYTKNAILIFACNKDITTIDTNIRRIFMHEFNLHNDKDVESLAMQTLPKGKSRDWHNALMDYGSTIATSRLTGIKPKTTQSKFEGSDRQLRAQILRHFLNNPHKQHTVTTLQTLTQSSQQRLLKILSTLNKDNLIKKVNNTYTLQQ